ncbi:hypothetical protein MBRA_01891 [Methylobacterium brachiatum]|nr:hypothetical protein MBRA_01891 [Methylobacterium brachiatum]
MARNMEFKSEFLPEDPTLCALYRQACVNNRQKYHAESRRWRRLNSCWHVFCLFSWRCDAGRLLFRERRRARFFLFCVRNATIWLAGILFARRSGIPWERQPTAMGCRCRMCRWRWLRDWRAAGVWSRLHAGGIDLSRTCLDKAPVSAKKGAGQRSTPRGPRLSRHQTPPRHRRLRHAVRLLRERGQPTRRCVMATNPVSAPRSTTPAAPTSRTPAKPTIPGPSVRVIRRAGCALDRSRHDTLAQIPGQR